MANAKLDVDIGAFQSNIKAAQGVLKGLDAQMKAADATFKATGNSEKQLADKTRTLNSQLQVQKGIADQAKQALKAMDEVGVDPLDASYQKLYATMMTATAGMNNAQAELNALSDSAQGASGSADQLTTSVQSIGKKISLDQVISGIDKITSSLEAAGKKAVELGKDIWNNIMDSARLSDDILTEAGILDMTPEQYQKYKGVFNTIGEVTITEWAATKRKIEKAMVDPSSEQIDIFKALGFKEVRSQGYGQFEEVLKIADNWEDVFWQVGSELRKRVESGEMSSAMADVYGEALFGKKYSSMKNLLKLGQEGFEAALNKQNIISDEALEKDAALNDAVIKLQDSFNALKAEVTSALAPALTDAANALDGVLGKVLEYLKTEEGKKLLEDLGTAVSGLFDDLGKIDPEQVVSGFTGVITTVTDGIKWLVDNAETVKGILEVIVGAWALSNVAVAGLEITKLVQGLQGLLGGGASAAAGQAGAAAGTSWAAGFSNAVAVGFPMLAGMLGITAVALTPAMIVQAQARQKWQSQYYERAAVAAMGGENSWFINQANETFGMDGQTRREMAESLLMGLADRQNQQKAELYNLLSGRFTSEAGNTWNALNAFWGGAEMDPGQINAMLQDITDAMAAADNHVQVPIEPEVPADTAGKISEMIGPVSVSVFLRRSGFFGLPGFANGINSVPYDGMLAVLHKGEQVVPAREVASRSFSSNLYVENMNMGGGLSADALAAAIAGRNRRMMAGYGS